MTGLLDLVQRNADSRFSLYNIEILHVLRFFASDI